ncbi:hypothetical protein Tco_1132221 [Tanacetum coccineum]|uniref:Uncharacterized protein n=1 Tax=Tanacetum coccineum TaxID=301880 RepID=A0ABQ5JB97_9ASTR
MGDCQGGKVGGIRVLVERGKGYYPMGNLKVTGEAKGSTEMELMLTEKLCAPPRTWTRYGVIRGRRFYTSAGNPIKEILLKLNLPDHRLLKDGGEALAKMMASKYVMASDSYNIQKNQEMSELLKIKKQELELKAAESEIRRLENHQRDETLYETMTDEELKARLR